jgi:hypothetical protein
MCKVLLSVLNTCTLIPVVQRKAFRMVCKVCLEGWGNNDLRNVKDLEPHFRLDRANTISLKLLLLPSGLCLLFPSICQKSLSLYIQKDERDYIQLTTSFRFCHVLFIKFANHSLSGLNSVIQFLFPCIFVTLSKPSSFIKECRALHVGE